MNVIQGADAILSFDNGSGLVPAVCTENVGITIDADVVDTRTVGDGNWKKPSYQTLTYTLTFGGVMVFNDTNFRFWDILQNQTSGLTLPFRLSFTDDIGNIKSMEGTVLIKSSNISGTVGQVTKGTFTLMGVGKVAMFDGLVPCPSVITAITVTGQTGSSGTVSVAYTYTGDVAQVKYRVDGIGAYAYALAGAAINISGLAVATHSIEIVPICPNGYEGTGMTQTFQVTQSLTCSSTCTGITIYTPDGTRFSGLSSGITINTTSTSMYIVPTLTGSPSNYKYAWDGGANFTMMRATDSIPMNSLAAGTHSLVIIPVCVFTGNQQVNGTQGSFSFTLAAQPSQSVLNWSYVNFPPGNSFSIYVAGQLVISQSTAGGSGSINIAVGATVQIVLATNTQPVGSRSATMTVNDTTTGHQLYNNSGTSPRTLSFTFTANGDTFSTNGVVSA